MADPIISDVKAEGSKIVAFVKKNWGHFVTWFLVAGPALLKHL